MKLSFNVVNQMCMRQDLFDAVSDSTNYLTAKFSFETDDWNGTTKTAVFKNGPLVKNMILDENNECIVPAEVIDAGYLYVSVFGVKETNYRITSNFAVVDINQSGYLQGGEPVDLTPSQFEQLAALVASKLAAGDLKTINHQSLVGDGDIEIQGGSGAQIDDEHASTGTVYSSSKVEALVDAKPSINDTTVSTTSVYSSAKVVEVINSAINSIPTAESQEV